VQVRELERSGLDSSVARALLEIYEESKAMAPFNRDSVAKAVALAQGTTGPAVDPSIDDADHDDTGHDETFLDDDFFNREADP
jgi:hypothetical protein